jgi:RimJ/RimL family protein N-acetyltransferase
VESDRQRFVELFRDADFMKFAVPRRQRTLEEANTQFSEMVSRAKQLAPFGELVVIPLATSVISGFSGMAEFDLLDEGRNLELNCRLAKEAREMGHATEACQAMISRWEEARGGELFARTDSKNEEAIKAISKLGFEFHRVIPVDGPRPYHCFRLYRAERSDRNL